MTEPQVLVVTSAGAASSAVMPVMAAIESAGMRVRAIDVGNVGGGGAGVTDRVRRALLGEGAERRLKKELETTPPDAAVVFDPHAAIALTVARDQVLTASAAAVPVIAVIGDLEPLATWSQTDCDRFIAIDELAAVALADAGVEADRILVVGAIGERAFADAAAQDRAALRTRFKLSGKVALVEVAGLGAEQTGQLALQLSLLDGGDAITFLFDAGTDVESAAVLRRQVPSLGLRGKLFGATADAPLLWRAADVVVARPRQDVIARVLLLGGKLVALVDDSVAGAAKSAAALEARKRGIGARGLLLLSSALDAAFGGTAPAPTPDGADNVADIAYAIAGDKRGVVDERRAAAQAATRERVRAASAASSAAAATSAMPGELEDLGGSTVESAAVPDASELARLRAEVEQRKAELTASMMAARDAASRAGDEAKAARARGATDEAVQLERKAEGERTRMHASLAELATLETELAELERVRSTVRDAAPKTNDSRSQRSHVPPRPSIDDALADLKKRSGAPPTSGQTGQTNQTRKTARPDPTIDDELAALKKKMGPNAPKKKP